MFKSFSVYAEIPGETIFDIEGDVPIEHIDVIKLESSLSNETLNVKFFLKNVPFELNFNRSGVPKNYAEYNWCVNIDVDDNKSTGLAGAEYSLSAMHFVFVTDIPVTMPISEGVQVNTWQLSEEGGGTYFEAALIEVDENQNTITLIGDIPGITLQSKICFETYDFNPEGISYSDTSCVSIDYFDGDFNNDYDVDGEDLYEFSFAYWNSIFPDADINGDGAIDTGDVERFAQDFGRVAP